MRVRALYVVKSLHLLQAGSDKTGVINRWRGSVHLHLEVDVERADLRQPGGNADGGNSVELGRQLAVLAESGNDLIFCAGSDLLGMGHRRPAGRPAANGTEHTKTK